MRDSLLLTIDRQNVRAYSGYCSMRPEVITRFTVVMILELNSGWHSVMKRSWC